MNVLDELVTGNPLPTWRMLAWPIMIFLSILIAWAFLTDLEEVSVAEGEVVPPPSPIISIRSSLSA